MGGKHKQAQRTKNNARPSSSGRSAELLGASINPFAGFSTIKDASLPALSGLPFGSTSNDEIDGNMDANFQLVLKKMNKKDSTTKLKALQEFTELVRSSQPDAVKAVLSVWPRLYAALAVDTEHRVREATHIAHRAVVLQVRRELAPYLRQLAGPWFTSQYDTYAPAATAATQSFQDAFPANKVPEAIVFCQDEILSYICDNITVQTPQTLSNPKTTTPEDAEAKYERLLIASLQGYTLYLNKLSGEQIQSAEELNNRIISSPKFWKLCKTKIPLIRAAWFGCIVALFQSAPFLLKNETQQVTSAVFCNLDEPEPSVLGATWDAALFIIANIEDWWKYVSVEKLVLPKLWKVLKEAGQGSAVVVYPNLLLLISHFPTTVDASHLYGNFFENIRIGMKKRTVIQSRLELGAIATSFIECFRYIIKDNITNLDLCQSLVSSHLIPTIEWSFTEDSVITKILYSEISSLLQYWGQNRNHPEFKNYNELIESFLKHLEQIIQSSLNLKDQTYTKERILSVINKQIELFLCLKRSGISKQKKHKVQFMSPEQKPGGGDSTVESLNDLQNPIITEINTLVHKTCTFYLKFEIDSKRSEVIAPLCLLMQNFENEELFRYLNVHHESIDKANNLVDLIRNVFLKFLKIKSTCSESVVDMIFIIYKYLTEEERAAVLDCLVKLRNEDTFCWCIAKALSHPLCNDSTIQKWLSTTPITKLLVNIATNMLADEISPEKSLLLKQALSQNIDGELYISKEACQEIMLIFCNCLLSPAEYPFTIDVCASFAAQLSSTLYTEQTLLTYGDQLVLALFSMSCNASYDPETVSTDTLWEVGTAWQDVLSIFISANLTTEFNNIMWKFTKVLQNEFMTNDNSSIMERLTSVTVDLIKCVLQNVDKPKSINEIMKTFLNLPAPLRTIYQHFTEICNCARIIKGNLSWPEACPVAENILELSCDESKILKYFTWNQFIMTVLSALFSKPDDDPDDEDEIKEAILDESTDDINNLIVSALHSYSIANIFTDNYKSSKLYKAMSKLCTVTKTEYSNFLNNIPKDMLDNIIQLIELNNYDTTYIVHNDLISNDKKKNIYAKLVKSNTNVPTFTSLHLTQIFSKHLTFDDMKEIKNSAEKIIITRVLLHSEDIDVQIAEALNAAMSIREKNVAALLYNRDVSGCKWQDIQTVVEITRLLKTIIDKNPFYFSSQHWDFILISLTSWANSVDRSKDHYRKLQVAEFISAVCELYMSFYKFIKNGELTSQLSQSCSNIVVEYCDIFAHDVHVSLINTWMAIATKELELSNTCISLLPALEVIGSMVSCFEDKYLIQIGNARLPKWQTYLQTCGSLLRASISILQLWGYQGLIKAIPALIVLDETAAKEDETRTIGLMSSQLGHILTSVQEVVQTMLMDFKLGEESCRVESFTDSYTFTFAYLLLWDIFLSYCQLASNDLRYQFSDWLRSGDYLKNLLNNVFRLMPTEVLHCSDSKKSSVVELFTVEPSFNLSDPPTSELLEHAVCWVYARALTHLPALVRQWWADAEPRAAHTADQVTAAHISPVLCAHELRDVTERRKSAGENMRVSVHPSAREVVASYTVDEARMELVITLPQNHPLGPVHVECSKQIGGTAQWRSWVMQLTVFLTHQNGRIWDGLSLWKSNLDKKFDGIEECYICFSVLHNATYQLPKLSCQTCRKKFHAPCLYKWFSTSNKSTCPICRNLF